MIFCLVDNGHGFDWHGPVVRSMFGPWHPSGSYSEYTHMISEVL